MVDTNKKKWEIKSIKLKKNIEAEFEYEAFSQIANEILEGRFELKIGKIGEKIKGKEIKEIQEREKDRFDYPNSLDDDYPYNNDDEEENEEEKY